MNKHLEILAVPAFAKPATDPDLACKLNLCYARQARIVFRNWLAARDYSQMLESRLSSGT